MDEQWGWPPGTYLAPMFGLAAQTAYRLSEDELFRKMAGAAKTCGWWTVRKTAHGIQPPEAPPATVGAGFWPNEATAFVPLEGPLDVTFWVDWVSSQQFLICLRWLVQEVNLRSAGRIAVDPVTLSGNVLGRPGKLALRAEEVQVEAPHQQVNWLGYRTDRSHVLVLINDDAAVTAKVSFPLLDTSPATVSTTTDGKQWRQEKPRTGGPLEIALPAESCALIAWQLGNSGGNSEHRGPRVT